MVSIQPSAQINTLEISIGRGYHPESLQIPPFQIPTLFFDVLRFQKEHLLHLNWKLRLSNDFKMTWITVLSLDNWLKMTKNRLFFCNFMRRYFHNHVRYDDMVRDGWKGCPKVLSPAIWSSQHQNCEPPRPFRHAMIWPIFDRNFEHKSKFRQHLGQQVLTKLFSPKSTHQTGQKTYL